MNSGQPEFSFFSFQRQLISSIFLSTLTSEQKPSWQILLYHLIVDMFFVVYLVAWHGDPVKEDLAWTFLKIWMVTSALYLLTFSFAKQTPFGRFPRNMNLGLAMLVGFVMAFSMLFISIALAKVTSSGMAVLSLPEFIENISALFGFHFPKLQIKPILLDVMAGFEAVGWQAVVSGVEEGLKLALTLALTFVLCMVVKHKKGKVTPSQRSLILAVCIVVQGVFWLALHGLQAYTQPVEFASAFIALLIMSASTFIFGNPFPAFFGHWLYNVMAPALGAFLKSVIAMTLIATFHQVLTFFS